MFYYTFERKEDFALVFVTCFASGFYTIQCTCLFAFYFCFIVFSLYGQKNISKLTFLAVIKHVSMHIFIHL